MLLPYLKKVMKIILIMLLHVSICVVVAHVHNLTIEQMIFFNTGGLSFGAFGVIFLFIFSLPIFLFFRMVKIKFVIFELVGNVLITVFSLICLFLKIDVVFIAISVVSGFLSFLFCLLFVFTIYKSIPKIKRILFVSWGYLVFVAMMLVVPYFMKVFEVTWLYFQD